MEAGPLYDKQRIQMGCAKAILSSSISGVELTTTNVLIALASDISTNKPWQGQHRFWKYVSPIRTYFAWLPEQLALTLGTGGLSTHAPRKAEVVLWNSVY